MGLASALSTALTGLTAAETTIDVVGNNLANSNTVGFKASEATFATQFLQTRSLGSQPTSFNGGTNPRQVGLGTMVVDITPNFSQGTIEISSSPTDLAIQGEGFFIVQGKSSEHLYTRNGIFKLNSQSELVTVTGHRLLGYGVDNQFQIQATTLVPLTIPLGARSVSRPTQYAYLEGTLTPTGNIATTAGVIETVSLTDGQWTRPETLASATTPASLNWLGATITPSAGGGVPAGTYYYKVVYADAPLGDPNNTEGVASEASSAVVVPAGGGTVDLTNVPVNANYKYARFYRTTGASGTGTYYYVGEVATGFAAPSSITVTSISSPTGELSTGEEYYYRFVWADALGNEGPATTVLTAARGVVGAGGNALRLSNLDAISNPDPGTYTHLRIYRTRKDPRADAYSDYYHVGTVPAGTATYDDGLNDVNLTTKLITRVNFTDDNSGYDESVVLNQANMLSGSYTYYITFFDSTTGRESRPSNAIEGARPEHSRVHLTNLPVDSSGQWTGMRIYRNCNDDASTFYMVKQIDGIVNGSVCFTDSVPDAVIRDKTSSNYRVLNFDGPPIQSSTLLSNILRREGTTDYVRVFEIPEEDQGYATLQFTGRKGGRSLAMKEFSITPSSTALDLATFLERAMGIQRPPGPDSRHPIPKSLDANNPGATLDPGAVVDGATGRIRIVGNNGVDNAPSIGLSSLKLITSRTATNVNLSFSTVQQPVGESAVTDFVVYDSLGIACQVRLTVVLENRTKTATTYRWFADSPDNDPQTGLRIAVGTGLITFDGEGNFITAYGNTVSIDRAHVPSASPLEFTLDFSQISGLAAERSSIAVSRQDGSAPGVLTSFIVGEDGRIRGVFSNGITRDLGQIRLARFSNPAGLEQKGQNLFAPGVNSGLPIEGNPNEQGIGSIIAGAQELSNTDIGSNLIDLILASTMYRGNTRVITTSQQMLDELLALRR